VESLAGRREFAGRMEARRRAEGGDDYEPEGWCVGSEEFRQELLAQVVAQAGPRHTGPEVTDSAQSKAERIGQEELQRLGWAVQDLEARRKGEPRKVKIAARLRRESTMSLAWIAQRLRMGTPGYVACLLYPKDDENPGTKNKLF